MTENPKPQSVVIKSESTQASNELSTQEKLEWAVSNRLIQLSFKRPDLKEAATQLLKLTNQKMADKLEKGEYKEDPHQRFNLKKFERTTVKKLMNLAPYANSDKFKNTNALNLINEIVSKLDPQQAGALTSLSGFVGDYEFPLSRSPELE